MQRMYQGIVESRMLEEFLHKRDKEAKLHSSRGQEACRIAALVDLEPEDLVSELPTDVTTAFLLGADLSGVMEHADAKASGKKKAVVATAPHLTSLLPETTDSIERLYLSLGAALAIKRHNPSRIVVVFTEIDEIKASAWKKVLHVAAREELPMLFVVLPRSSSKASVKASRKVASFDLSNRATKAGVPGIPVDASDAVALYRVVQESIGRARAGGGPALMECTHFLIEGQKKVAAPDPAIAMGQTLLDRKICSGSWLTEVIMNFQERLNGI
jgi:TPP-dependent pyruvate/acetoin dehydrogenase alpha subunit